jgi:misacylated tRNA(Ala) deacylase
MAVPGRAATHSHGPGGLPPGAPRDVAEAELFAVDAYLREFGSAVAAVDRDQGRVALRRTAFFPGGGGQPHDVGTLRWADGTATVTRVARDRERPGTIWHWVDLTSLPGGDAAALPGEDTEVLGALDWERRHLTMRTHTALHILCGVIWADHRVAVTGGNMEPGTGRLDFPLPSMSAEFGRRVETRVNEEIAAAREIVVSFVGREVADEDHALIRTAAHLIPREVDPLRVIDIVGLDKQADGGTHVVSTSEVGRVVVTGTESKGRGNKRVRLEIAGRADASAVDGDRAGGEVVQAPPV